MTRTWIVMVSLSLVAWTSSAAARPTQWDPTTEYCPKEAACKADCNKPGRTPSDIAHCQTFCWELCKGAPMPAQRATKGTTSPGAATQGGQIAPGTPELEQVNSCKAAYEKCVSDQGCRRPGRAAAAVKACEQYCAARHPVACQETLQ